jgi:hypothetical protein
MDKFVNPFEVGVNYEHFLTALGAKTIKTYCKGKLTNEQIEWLINDLKHYKLNKNK